VSGLVDALAKREREYRDALSTIRDLAESESANAAYWLLREAVEIVGCARRLLKDRTLHEVHAAFGAPGDFGYDTPIGDALASIYGARS
jgi:hypothetical protein